MDTMPVSILTAKVLCLMLLALAAIGCGVRVEERGDAAAAGSGANRLVMMLDGDTAFEVDTRSVDCRVSDEDEQLTARFRGEAGSGAEGILVRLAVTGDLEDGDALTPDNSRLDRHFDLRIAGGDGRQYRYNSYDGYGAQSGEGAAYAALTTLAAGDLLRSYRVWIERLAGTPADAGDPPPTVSVRGTVTCASWHAD